MSDHHAAVDFLVAHYGRYIAPGVTDPAAILGAGHPILGTRGQKSNGDPAFRGAKDNNSFCFLITQHRISFETYLGVYFTTPKAAEEKAKAGKSVFFVHDHLPALLQAAGVTRDFPVHVRVWRSENDIGTPIPDHVLDDYAGFPIEFWDEPCSTIRFGVFSMSYVMQSEVRALAQSGEPYLCLGVPKSQSNLVPFLRIFSGVFGVSTPSGIIFGGSERRAGVLNRVSQFGARSIYFSRVIRALQLQRTVPKMIPPGLFNKENGDQWALDLLSRKNKLNRAGWDGHDHQELVDHDPDLADGVRHVAQFCVNDGLTDSELAQAQNQALNQVC